MRARSCVLCGREQVSLVQHVRYSDIWRTLGADFEVDVPEVLRSSLTPAATCDLLECGACEIEFFDPVVPASPAYYDLLAASGRYYEIDRWEFSEIARNLRGSETVVDFASGAGRFSELAADRGCAVIAVDTNPRATSRHPHVEVHREVPSSAAGTFDVFCGFQVIEHVSDPAGFARMARDLVRPGGTIALSVPNRRRVGRQPMEPLDHPPHHLTRWTPRSLEVLGEVTGLRLDEVRFEPPIRWDVRATIRSRFSSVLSDRSARVLGRAMYPTFLDKLLRRRASHWRLHLYGHTMLGIYRRPD